MIELILLPLADCKPPTLPEMLVMPTKANGTKVSIPTQIGSEYRTFGILLLQDDNGKFVSNIVHGEKENGVEGIVISIIMEWLQGRGRLPVSWRTLIEVLREMNLKVLAHAVEGKLRSV